MIEKLVSIIASPLSFILVISVVITIHELGHYWVGRFFGAAVESFAIGFGKPVFEVKDKRGTRWRLNWLPLGGFVKFVGEMQAPTDSRDGAIPSRPVGKAYTELEPLKRLAVSLGGPFANFIFAILIFAAMGMGLGVAESREVRVTQVHAESPAERAGFQIGDVVLEAGGRRVATNNDVTRATILKAGEGVRYVVSRDGERLTLTAVPEEQRLYNEAYKVSEKVGRIGLELGNVGLNVRRLGPLESISYGVATTGDAISATVTVLRQLVTGQGGFDKMSGPLGIANLTDNVTDRHMKQPDVPLTERLRQVSLRLLELAALLSIGIGFFNLLPIPVLDGGAAMMCLAEAVTGRDIPEKVQRIGLSIGLACLVSFALAITIQDVTKLPWWPGGP